MPSPTPTVIIVVDDDSEVNQAIQTLLDVAGFRTDTYFSAEALLEAGTAATAACLVLDVHLPGLSGFDLRRRLQSDGIAPPAIFITAHDDPASREQAREAGASAWFRKPFAGKQFLAAIQRAVGAQAGTSAGSQPKMKSLPPSPLNPTETRNTEHQPNARK
jgi:FixJ family two-component response regulator